MFHIKLVVLEFIFLLFVQKIIGLFRCVNEFDVGNWKLCK